MAIQLTRRIITDGGLELRMDSSSLTLEGYASTFDQPYNMGWYDENIQRGAFKKTLSENPDVSLLVNHEGLPLARTRSKTLDLSEDSTGLHVRSQLDMSDPDVQRIAPKVKRGDVDSMSFAFRPVKQAWDAGHTTRSISEASLAGGDVSVVTDPANPNTSVQFRMRGLVAADPDKIRSLYAQVSSEDFDGSPEMALQLRSALESLDSDDTIVDEIEKLLNPEVVESRGVPVRDALMRIALARR